MQGTMRPTAGALQQTVGCWHVPAGIPHAQQALRGRILPEELKQRCSATKPRAARQSAVTAAKLAEGKAGTPSRSLRQQPAAPQQQQQQQDSNELVALREAAKASLSSPAPAEWVDRFGSEPRKGADILVQCLEREGAFRVFAYPGGASMEIHQALTRSGIIRNILCRHEQGEIFAAEGYAKCTGDVGVCIATSGPGATNLVTGLADAMLDSVPLVAITGQVPRKMIGTDGFQETPIVEVTRQITKHNFLVMDLDDLPRIMKEAFYLARTGRPGPVLVDVPKDIQQQLAVPDWDTPMAISGYMSRLPAPPNPSQLAAVVRALKEAKRPTLYVGGGALDSSAELREFVRLTDIPVAQTLMGLGTFPEEDPLALQMLGMHGTVYANYAVNDSDLLLAFGVRFDDRVTGKLEAFASRARIVHIDIDPAEICKNKEAHIPICADLRASLIALNELLRRDPLPEGAFADWRAAIEAKKQEFPMTFPERDDVIIPQRAIQMLYEETNGEAIISTGVGQHQMWAAQWYQYNEPRRWVTSGGLGSMGFGLPSALGAAVAYDGTDGRPKKVVVDIDGDGSFLMNCQELATAAVEGLETKIMILNNQHLGMVVQSEDRFYKANRAHTYLGHRANEYHTTLDESHIFPDFVMMAKSCGVPGRRVIKPEELRGAIREMLDTPGPFLLDVMVPHVEHVLPMIPGGGSFKDIITKGDGRDEY
uniref:Acetolactate synthase n=1 Tax=Lobosphaera incisa TaxID=312850 RepID=I3VJH3_9CHLO|nr:acetohydroxyacid synthase [Lobosphaera incisa]